MIFLPSPLPSPDGTLSQSEPCPPSGFREGPGCRQGAVCWAAALAPEDTYELEGRTHTSDCCLDGVEVTGLQVMAGMFLPGPAVVGLLRIMGRSLRGC